MDAGPFEGAEKGDHEHQYRQSCGRKQDANDNGYRIEKSRDGAQGEVVHGLFLEGEEKSGRSYRNGDDVYGRLRQPSFGVKENPCFLELLQGEVVDQDGAAVENEVREGRIPQGSGGDIDESKDESHGENAHEFKGRKVDGREHKGLKQDSASSGLKTLCGHGGDESTEDVLLKNGRHEGQDEQADKQLWENFHVEHRFKYRLSFGIQQRKRAGKIAQGQVFEKGGRQGHEWNHANGKQGGAHEFFAAQFLGVSSDLVGLVLGDQGDEQCGDGHEGGELQQVAPAQYIDSQGRARGVVEQLRGLIGRKTVKDFAHEL